MTPQRLRKLARREARLGHDFAQAKQQHRHVDQQAFTKKMIESAKLAGKIEKELLNEAGKQLLASMKPRTSG